MNDQVFEPGDEIMRVGHADPRGICIPYSGTSPKFGEVYCVEDFGHGHIFNWVMPVGFGGPFYDSKGRKIGWAASAFRKASEIKLILEAVKKVEAKVGGGDMTAAPTPLDGERELANQIRYLWSDMAPGELEKLIAAHVSQRVAEARKAWESESATDAHRSALEAVEYWKDQWNKQTAERDQLAALVVRLKEALDSLKGVDTWRVRVEIVNQVLALVPSDLSDSVCVKQNRALRALFTQAVDCAEYGWTIIANASGGNWTKESKDWKEAAEKWRDGSYYKLLDARKALAPKEGNAP
jgi:hypothetical protein